mmetsp:Transcript_65054/g.172284  ORF Transcript_65054/g.172284 Transcript_65054/m.172284 type:complete len:313 (-) Transcript_65054:1365-2303(-)
MSWRPHSTSSPSSEVFFRRSTGVAVTRTSQGAASPPRGCRVGHRRRSEWSVKCVSQSRRARDREALLTAGIGPRPSKDSRSRPRNLVPRIADVAAASSSHVARGGASCESVTAVVVPIPNVPPRARSLGAVLQTSLLRVQNHRAQRWISHASHARLVKFLRIRFTTLKRGCRHVDGRPRGLNAEAAAAVPCIDERTHSGGVHQIHKPVAFAHPSTEGRRHVVVIAQRYKTAGGQFLNKAFLCDAVGQVADHQGGDALGLEQRRQGRGGLIVGTPTQVGSTAPSSLLLLWRGARCWARKGEVLRDTLNSRVTH